MNNQKPVKNTPRKLLVICGPTSTGKTTLGIYLAKKFNGEIISADSRQVYKDMDIGTGKDLPPGTPFQKVNNEFGFYNIDGVNIYGYDLVSPKEEYSISQYLKFVRYIIPLIQKKGELPIVVGGTGFYIKAIIDGIPTLNVPRNSSLREVLSTKKAEELYESLSQTDSVKAASLNSSDSKNPRRLIRAIEVAQYLLDHKLPVNHTAATHNWDTLFIGLSAIKEELEKRIDKRVKTRVNAGIKNEIQNLLNNGVNWHHQSMFSLGYRQYRDYFEGGVDEEIVINEWQKEEKKYARRQMVWWKKESRINWFDISDSGYQKKVEKMVSMWHNQSSDA